LITAYTIVPVLATRAQSDACSNSTASWPLRMSSLRHRPVVINNASPTLNTW